MRLNRSIINTVTLGLALLLCACSDGPALSDEDQVRETLAAIELAAQERSLSGMTDHISENYRDFEGNDFKKIRGLLQFQIIRNQSINIFSKIRELEVIGDSATVELSMAMTSRKIDLSAEKNRLRADTHRFSIVLKRQEKQWKIQSASRKPGW